MKAEITEYGELSIKAQNKTESYALKKWEEENIDQCTGNFRKIPVKTFYLDTRIPKINVFNRILFKIRLFLYR